MTLSKEDRIQIALGTMQYHKIKLIRLMHTDDRIADERTVLAASVSDAINKYWKNNFKLIKSVVDENHGHKVNIETGDYNCVFSALEVLHMSKDFKWTMK